MANLPESEVWEPGIYQFEETDPVQGGPNGIDNQQGKQLANRTAYLKAQVESLGTGKQPLDQTLSAIAALVGIADRIIYFNGPDTVAMTPLTAFIRTLLDDANASTARATLGAISQDQLDSAIAALVNSSPAALDTLNELAAALGNDANFATTITNALALKAALASPIFTGDPKAPTPAQFDNDTSLATTEFVQRSLGNFAGRLGANASQTLPATAAGKIVNSNGVGVTLTLPLSTSVPAGAVICFENDGPDITIARQGGEFISTGSSNYTSITLKSGDTLIFESNTLGTWRVIGGSGQLPYSNLFGSSRVSSGYQKLPSGLIIQWGITSSITSGGSTTVTFPITFPNACLEVVASLSGGIPTQQYTNAITINSDSQMTIGSLASAAAAATYRWIAIGY